MSRARLALAVLLASATHAHAYTVPTLADGKTPDLRGIWQVHDTAYLNIEGHPAVAGVAAAPSIIVDPPDHRLPYRPDALAQRNATVAKGPDGDPARKCFEAGIPRATYLPSPFQIVQSIGSNAGTAFLYQDNHAFRIVYPASKPHADGLDWWMGDSRGRWDGATLVVDGTSYNHLAWLDAAGNHHSDDMHVIERYTRTGPDTMQYEARIEDPTVFTRPWTLRETLYRDTRPGARIAEDECLDDRNGVRRHVADTDPANLQRNRYTRWAIAQKLGLLSTGVDISTPPGEPPGNSAGDPPNPPAPTGPVPRLPDGHPDFNGIWRSIPNVGAPPAPGGGAKDPIFLAVRVPKPGEDASRDFARVGVPRLPYTMAGQQEQMWRSRHQFLDGEPRCHLAGVPRAIQQPPYPQQIIQDDRMVAILHEYVHEPRLAAFGAAAHPRGYTAWDGDARAHWQGDTLVIDDADFNGRTWLNMTGNFVDENEHVVERYSFIDPNTVYLSVTVTDPAVFATPFAYKLTMRRQAASEQILEYACLEGEADRQHYTEQFGGHSGPAAPAAPAAPQPTAIATVTGCLRGSQTGSDVAFRLQTHTAGLLRVSAAPATRRGMVELLDREVLLGGQPAPGGFHADTVEVLSEGCDATFK